MKINAKKLFNFFFIAGTFAVVLIIAFSNHELADAWQTLFTLDPKWILIALSGWFAYVFFNTLSLYVFLRNQKYSVSFLYAFSVTLIGFYYANITPGASGGEPMQIFYLRKRNVPVGVGTSIATIKLFCSQLMVVLTGFILWLFNREAIAAQLGGVKWFIIIGGIINFSAVPLLLLVGFYRPPAQALVNFCIRIGTKIRLIKDPERITQSANAIMDTYHASIQQLAKAPAQVLAQLLFMGLGLFGLLSVPVSIYYAFGLSGTPWPHLLTISYMVFWSASYTLPPGGSGAQEGGFFVYYSSIFTSGTIGLALLIWRFITFYIFLLLGPLVTLILDFMLKRKDKVETQAEDSGTET